jgi:transposase
VPSDTGASDHRGFVTAEIARRFRVSEDKVRGWIARRELRALNTADPASGKKRYVVTPEALAEFEAARQAATPAPKPARRRKRMAGQIDFFP